MKAIYTFVLMVLFTSALIKAQELDVPVYHPFTGTVVLTAEAGPNVTYTDYKFDALQIDFTGRGLVEYFFPFHSKSIFGIRAFGEAGYVKGKDNGRTPSKFRTSLVSAGGGLVYGLSINEVVFPYIFAGGSYDWLTPKDDNGNAIAVADKQQFSAIGELGFRFAITYNMSINIAGSVHIGQKDYLDGLKKSSETDAYFSGVAGISIALNASKDTDHDGIPDEFDKCPDTPIGIRADATGCPPDFDHDGVPDYRDKCSLTPEGVKVDENGCPLDSDHDGVPDYIDMCPGTAAGIAVDEYGCPKDSDGDGVPDYLDQCPNTPKGAAVDIHGCPLDSDGDKVPDYMDKCPNTPAGVQVDNFGCPLVKEKVEVIREVPVIKEVPVEKEIVLSAGTSFATGKSVLLKAASAVLDQLVKIMKDNPQSTWIIEGHTDNVGAKDKNKKLSLARAQAVQKYFVSKGLQKDRFTVRGLGSDFPVADNNTQDGRSQNRRVVIIRVK